MATSYETRLKDVEDEVLRAANTLGDWEAMRLYGLKCHIAFNKWLNSPKRKGRYKPNRAYRSIRAIDGYNLPLIDRVDRRVREKVTQLRAEKEELRNQLKEKDEIIARLKENDFERYSMTLLRLLEAVEDI